MSWRSIHLRVVSPNDESFLGNMSLYEQVLSCLLFPRGPKARLLQSMLQKLVLTGDKDLQDCLERCSFVLHMLTNSKASWLFNKCTYMFQLSYFCVPPV